jgi:hypothetical protein
VGVGNTVENFDAPEADFRRPVRRDAWPMSRIDRHAAPAGSAKIGSVAAVTTM